MRIEFGVRQWISVFNLAFVRKLEKWTVKTLTLPYYRDFHRFNTSPLSRLQQCKDDDEVHALLVSWKDGKRQELRLVQIVSAFLAVSTIGCFSWQNIQDDYWLAPALWYSSLMLAIVAILISHQHSAILETMSITPANVEAAMHLWFYEGRHRDRLLKRNIVYVWQSPMMFSSYAVGFFMAALTIHVCTLLIRGDEWGPGTKIACFYLGVTFLALVNFVWGSYWVYKKPYRYSEGGETVVRQEAVC